MGRFREHPSRREAIRLLSGAAGAMLLGAARAEAAPAVTTRRIPSSGETLPAIGIGTWQTFDVGPSAAERKPLEEVLALFAARGGGVIDSSPMYGRSESVVGDLVSKMSPRPPFFLATKVWTSGRDEGVAQMEASLANLRVSRIDLEQVHNLVDAATHLPTLARWKAEGRVRYVGVSHYSAHAYPEVERVLRAERLDFLQINYSPVEPEAGQHLIPLAAERGVAVIANRPFGGGGALRRAAGRPLPGWAEEIGCRSWAQLFLKWILADPAITCAIPGTDKVRHLEENLEAAAGPLPDAGQRRRIAESVAGL